MVFVHAISHIDLKIRRKTNKGTLTTNANGEVSLCQRIMATTYTRKLIYCLEEANFTQSLLRLFSTRQPILAWSVSQSKPFILKVMYSRVDCGWSKERKQYSLHRKKRPRVLEKFQKVVTSEETSSPVAVPTATGKKLALAKPQSSSVEHSVSSPATDRACGPDSLFEMKGLWLIDKENLLASITRRASCDVCGSGHTVKQNQELKGSMY